MEARKVTKELPCALSTDELVEKAIALARELRRLRETKENAKDLAAECKSQAKLIEARIEDLAEQVRCGNEVRPVNCEERQDEDKLEVYVVRLDTTVSSEGGRPVFAEISRRPMNETERQRTIPGVRDVAPPDDGRGSAKATTPPRGKRPTKLTPGARIQ